ncbi:MAG: type II/IV secretion system protein [bacterium]|nr:type II/IV secretion system protein [bacterium]
MPKFQDAKQTKDFDELRAKEAEALAQILAERYELPYINLARVPIDNSAIKLIPEESARAAMLVVFAINQKHVSMAIQSKNDEKLAPVLEELARQGLTVSLHIASEYGIRKAWDVYKEVSYAKAETAGIISVSQETMDRYVSSIKNIADIKNIILKAVGSGDIHSLSTVVEIILGGAVATGSSDVHIEPEKEVVRVRYRLDGVLQDVVELKHANYKKVLSRIKLLAGVKLNITHEAQDGRFTIKISGVDVEVRTSILPAAYQESVVMRILNPNSISVPLEELGMDEYFYAAIVKQVEKPNGLILTTGPTGSGKTTTLYAILKKLRNPQIKIITIEDPIEYHLDGISQTQVDHSKGYDFQNGLRAAVRQDPDVIMVGEIRDDETASIAIDSALTGHLVFSTMHTNNAAGAIPRLIDLGVNPKIISSALNIALAQRLVRRLCVYCREAYIPEGRDKEVVESNFLEVKKYRPQLELPKELYRPIGCEKCTFTGYKGRISIYEGILMDRVIEAVLRENPSEREIKEAAKPQGMLDMRQDGIVKVIHGITSLDEVERAVGLEESR